jgi:dTDP-glucose pyrophosphorylase
MNFLITMAGEGRRFRDAGYTVPKMLIEAKGKTLLEWSVDSLPLHLCSRLIFVAQQQHEDAFRVSKKIISIYSSRVSSLHFKFIDKLTRGQSETACLAKHLIDPAKPLLIFNIDTQFVSSMLEKNLLRKDIDGVLGAFYSEEPRFSFASLDDEGFITRTAEKEVISSNALTGLYHFTRPADFFEAAEDAFAKNETTKGEFYIAPLYNHLIAKGRRLIVDMADEVNILGTPEELKIFLQRK